MTSTSGTGSMQDPHPITHPELTPDEDAQQRGDDPSNLITPLPPGPIVPAPDPAFTPDANLLQGLAQQFDDIGKRRRPHREDVLPYLLMRAYCPGDRGVRPTWPPLTCWESPDILLIDASHTGPFDASQLVASPISGRTYRVFVRLFNLGLVAALGTQVRAWYIDPGFFSGQPGYTPQFIGGTFVDLEDRTRAGAYALVELDAPWVIPIALTGHECLAAAASCVADQWTGGFDANQDRHVGVRNLMIAVGQQNIGPLLTQLGGMLPSGSALEVIHAGGAVVPLLQGLTGGRVAGEDGTTREIVAPDLASLQHGVLAKDGRHLLTAVIQDTGTVVAPSEALERAVPTPSPGSPTPRIDIFEQPGGTAQLLRSLDPHTLGTLGLTGGPRALGSLLPTTLQNTLSIGDLQASSIASALGGTPGATHLLRFVATDAAGGLIGGYSIGVAS
jgi:hypothetical protein